MSTRRVHPGRTPAERSAHPAGEPVRRSLRRAQVALGRTLRDRVAGPDAAERGERIWGTPGPRWFAPGDPIWRVQENASMFPGGVASLLLQSLHPSAMAGVAGHSGYRSDPWGRLQRTADYLATTTFGTVDDAEELIDRIRGIHARVRGKDHRGRPYRADDPHLLAWVHVAEVHAFLAAHQAYAPEPLTPAEADVFVAQSATVSERLGTSGLPTTVAGLQDRLEGFRAELEVTDAARDAADFLLRHPPLAPAARPGYWMLAAGGVAVLPGWAREMLGLPTHPVAVAAARAAGRAGTSTVRWAMAGLAVDRTTGATAEAAGTDAAPGRA